MINPHLLLLAARVGKMVDGGANGLNEPLRGSIQQCDFCCIGVYETSGRPHRISHPAWSVCGDPGASVASLRADAFLSTTTERSPDPVEGAQRLTPGRRRRAKEECLENHA